MKGKICILFFVLNLSMQIDIQFNYEYIKDNFYDKKEFIQYVLEDYVKDRINSILSLKSEKSFEFPTQFECEGITEIKQMPENLKTDLLIFVILEQTSNFIAQSKTCYYHQNNKRPIVGVIKLSIIRF